MPKANIDTLHLSRMRLVRSMVRGQRGKQDGPTADSNRITYWVGLFNGWETHDTNLMRVMHGSGHEIRNIPTKHHVVNSSVRFTVGETPVRVVQHGSQIWVDGVCVGDSDLSGGS